VRRFLVIIAVWCCAALAGTARAEEAAAPKAAANEPPAPWLPPTPPSNTPRLQQKLHVKVKHFQFDFVGQYLWRADFYYNPAAGIAFRYYPTENLAAEIAGSRFFSSLQPSVLEMRDKFGYVPDSHESHWLVRAGARGSVGYGKLLFGNKVIHVEPQVAAHLALLMGDASYAPGVDLSAGFLIHWTSFLHTTLEVVVFPHMERRSSWTVVTGVMPSLGIGFGWPP
jgi:hypothetical protein